MRTVTNPRLTDELVERLVAIWVEVTEAGGAVGFTPPVTAQDVSAAVAPFWDQVIDGLTDLVVITEDDGDVRAGSGVLGLGFLTPAPDPAVAGHRGELLKVMRRPSAAGRGVGAAVLEGLEACARSRGITLLTLTVRGGTGTEAFYRDHGWSMAARLPGWLRVDGEARELLVLTKDLTAQPAGHSADHSAARPAAEPAALPAAPEASRGGQPVRLLIRRLDPDLPLPAYARPGDAGLDLMARQDRVLPPGMRMVMPTGMAVAIPEGHVGLVHPRSGLAVREGLSIVNAPGTIDAGYRGELMVPLINLDPSASIRLRRGERIAQLVIQRVEHAQLVEVDELPDGVRGDGGFGSTGR